MAVSFLYIIFCMSFLSVATINVNGLRSDLKRNVLFEFLQRRKFDLIFLQETHSEISDEAVWSNQWQGKMFFSHGNRQSRGAAILYPQNPVLKLIILKGIMMGDG